MTFIIVLIIAFLIIMVFLTYRKLYSLAVGIVLVFGTTAAILVAGILIMGDGSYLNFFRNSIPRASFIHLITVWFVLDLVCACIMVRNYIAYRRVNRKN